ncbi:unnamed protein product [Prorocentrum cordatum]|uniref:Uncharacterized protein n=1 Tax=Prorocentrum cordatum TaxID=2364126 RepID=A0ABN9RDT1_9DINO|nr:unnamed protein product [Polarella glacialis]
MLSWFHQVQPLAKNVLKAGVASGSRSHVCAGSTALPGSLQQGVRLLLPALGAGGPRAAAAARKGRRGEEQEEQGRRPHLERSSARGGCGHGST